MKDGPLHEIAARINEGDDKGAWAVLLVFLHDLAAEVKRPRCLSDPEHDVKD